MNGAILSGDRHLSSNALLQRVRRAASGFSSLGVGEGDAIALLLRNDFAFFEAALAADMIGAYSVPINWHFKSAEAGYIISDSGAKVLVAHTDLLPAIQSAIPPGVRVFRVETPAEIREAYGSADSPVQTNDPLDWDEWVVAHPEWLEPARPARNAIIYTSGTTGKPKGVRRAPATPDMAARMGKLVKSALGLALDQTIRTVITGPIYHAAPNLYALWAVRGGGLVILQPKFDAEQLLAMIDQHRITHLHMVPTMFVRLLALPQETRARYNVSSLQFVAHAAAPCPPEVKRQMIAWWGPVIHEYYGGTETGGVVACNSADAIRKPGTVGRALEGCAIRILDDSGAILGPHQVGEIYIRNQSFPDFTYHQRDDLRAAIEKDGFVSLGDVGYLDEDGFLFLRDRARDIVISGGVNIYPAEIEAELVNMPGVADCAVFGIPDPQFGEKLCAFVEVQPGVSLNAAMVQDFLRARLADYKVPRYVEFHAQLPREDSGKIFKRQLRAPFWESAGRQI